MSSGFTVAYARILWGMMAENEQEAFRFLARLDGKQHTEADAEVIESLFEYELIKREKNLLDGKEIIVLTGRGKTMAKAVSKLELEPTNA